MQRQLHSHCHPGQALRTGCLAALVAILGACATIAPEREFVLAAPAVAADEEDAEFTEIGDVFAAQAACEMHLGDLVEMLPSAGYGIARGPYPLASGDVRAHAIRVQSSQYQVLEYRCLGPVLQVRSWWAAPAQVEDEPLTIESYLESTRQAEENQ